MLFTKCEIKILPLVAEKGSEREQLFDGEATNGKPRLRTREEILATYRKVCKFITSVLPYGPFIPSGESCQTLSTFMNDSTILPDFRMPLQLLDKQETSF